MMRGGATYAQQVATMSDGSMWEVPCVGNGSIWRQVGRSHAQLQETFNEHYLALQEQEKQTTGNGINNGH